MGSLSRDADVAPLAGDFTVDGGLYRSVSLVTTDQLSVRMLDNASPGVFLRQRTVSAASADIDATTELWNNSDSTRNVAVRTVVTDEEGTVVVDETSAPRSLAAGTGTGSDADGDSPARGVCEVASPRSTRANSTRPIGSTVRAGPAGSAAEVGAGTPPKESS